MHYFSQFLTAVLLVCSLSQSRTMVACPLDSIKMDLVDCNDEQFFVRFDWLDAPAQEDSFNIKGNGTFYGSYATSELPITIGPLPTDDRKYEFILENSRDPLCQTVFEPGQVRCDVTCYLKDLLLLPKECDDEGVNQLYVDFLHNGFTHFDLFVNDSLEGYYSIEDLPITIKGVPHGVALVSICANDQPDCCLSESVEIEQCPTQCLLKEADVATLECSDSLILLELNFGYQGLLDSDSFILKGSGMHYGTYTYGDLPVQLPPVDKGKSTYEFVILDQEERCRLIAEVSNPCLVDMCRTGQLSVNPVECYDDMFYVKISSDHIFKSEEVFYVTVDNQNFGAHRYNELPVVIGPLAVDDTSNHQVLLQDSIHLDCAVQTAVRSHCSCELQDLTWDFGRCTTDSTMVFELDFTPTTFSAFSLYAADAWIGEYHVEDLPLRLEDYPLWEDSSYQLKILPQGSAICVYSTQVQVPSCGPSPCNLRDLNVVESACIEGESYAWIDFDYTGVGETFSVRGNGQIYGDYFYQDLPVKVGPIPEHDDARFELVVRDKANEQCVIDGLFEGKSCREECPFGDIETSISACDDSLFFWVTLDLASLENRIDTFIVEVKGDHFSYSYSDLPVEIGPFPADGSFYEMTLRDGSDGCMERLPLGRVVCDEQCSISEVSVDVVECHDSLYIISISKPESPFHAYDVYLDQSYMGFFKESEFPLRMDIYHTGEESLVLKLCVSDNTTCCHEVELDLPSCNDHQCSFLELEGDTLDCEGGFYYVRAKVFHEGNGETFSVRVNGEHYGSYRYDNPEIDLGPFMADGVTYYEVIAVDDTDQRCAGVLSLDPVSCTDSFPPEGQRELILDTGARRFHFRVDDPGDERVYLTLFNLQGQKVYDLWFSSETNRMLLDIPVLPSGMYIVSLDNRHDFKTQRKFIAP